MLPDSNITASSLPEAAVSVALDTYFGWHEEGAWDPDELRDMGDALVAFLNALFTNEPVDLESSPTGRVRRAVPSEVLFAVLAKSREQAGS